MLALFKLLPINNQKLDGNFIYFSFIYGIQYRREIWVKSSLPYQREKLYMKNERNDNKPLCSMSHITLNSDFIHHVEPNGARHHSLGPFHVTPCCSMLFSILHARCCWLLFAAISKPYSTFYRYTRFDPLIWYQCEIHFHSFFFIDGAKNGQCASFHSQYAIYC